MSLLALYMCVLVYLQVVIADPVECLFLELLPLVSRPEAVHECEDYHHRNPTYAARLEQREREREGGGGE